MSNLLISVRSVEEAKAALEGGADLIDVKEPTRGPLGAADHDVIENIILEVNGRVPVSAAMGEWSEWDENQSQQIPQRLTFLKWGLAGIGPVNQHEVWKIRRRYQERAVLVAYADFERAKSIDPEDLVEISFESRFKTFLIDTAIKDGSTLLDWVDFKKLARWRLRLAEAGAKIALAGSLDEETIRLLAPLQPDWFAVRGAACDGGREGIVSVKKVRLLKAIIAEASLPIVEG